VDEEAGSTGLTSTGDGSIDISRGQSLCPLEFRATGFDLFEADYARNPFHIN
jgi:hypothetical protein